MLVFLARLCFGPLSPKLVFTFFFIPKAAISRYALFTMNEMIILRYMFVFIWKRIAPLDENFFAFFIISSNVLMSILQSVYGNLGYNVEQGIQILLTGTRDFNEDQVPVFR